MLLEVGNREVTKDINAYFDPNILWQFGKL